MDTQQLRQIKTLAIIAMFSDDDLLDRLVLKGGNAIDMIYKEVSARASVDLDFSMESDFDPNDLVDIEKRISKALQKTFDDEGYLAFDIKLIPRPSNIPENLRSFWGGYKIEFKVIEKRRFDASGGDIDDIRKRAIVVGRNQKRTFLIEISKHESCRTKEEVLFENYTIYVYTPEMIALEKLRAICQQMPEYKEIVQTATSSPRAKDFFDIYIVVEGKGLDLTTPENLSLLKNIFEAKRVPVGFLGEIQNYEAFHEQDFIRVVNTTHPDTKLKEFEFYFSYVTDVSRLLLESLGKV